MRISKRMRILKRMGKWLTIAVAAVSIVTLVFDVFDVVIDFVSIENRPPEIRDSIQLSQNVVPVGETATTMVVATDPDGGEDELRYFWGAALGRIQLDRFGGAKVTYVAPSQPGVDVITVTVYDSEGATVRDFTFVTITEAEEVESP